MGSSSSFRRLLEECLLPILKRQTLLAFPEDARLRDRFSSVFSLEALLAVEGAEGPLQNFFETEKAKQASSLSWKDSPLSPSVGKEEAEISAIITALKRINLIPNVMEESQVLQLIKDVLPEDSSCSRRVTAMKSNGNSNNVNKFLLFPQWEWVLSVVAFQAVETAVQQSSIPTDPEVKIMFISNSLSFFFI
jgi:hypothetical protein